MSDICNDDCSQCIIADYYQISLCMFVHILWSISMLPATCSICGCIENPEHLIRISMINQKSINNTFTIVWLIIFTSQISYNLQSRRFSLMEIITLLVLVTPPLNTLLLPCTASILFYKSIFVFTVSFMLLPQGYQFQIPKWILAVHYYFDLFFCVFRNTLCIIGSVATVEYSYMVENKVIDEFSTVRVTHSQCCVNMYVCTCEYLYVWILMCVCVHVCVCALMCTCVCVHMCVCVCTCVCMCMCTHTHT